MTDRALLVLSEDQELLAKTASDFVASKSPVRRVRELRDSNDPLGFSRELWKEMAELGWVGVPFPEAYGGAEMGLSELAVILEELGRTLPPEQHRRQEGLGRQLASEGFDDQHELGETHAGAALLLVEGNARPAELRHLPEQSTRIAELVTRIAQCSKSAHR